MSATPEINRLFPQSVDAERGLLCSFLLCPAEIGAICAERNITTAHFHIPSNAIVFSRLMEMWTDSHPIDIITLTQRLANGNELDVAGGAAYVTELYTFLPTATNAAYYAEICEEKRLLRALISFCTDYASRGYDEQHDPQGLIADAMAKVCAITSQFSAVTPKTPKEIVMEAADRVEDRINKRGLPNNVLLSGIPKLDESMAGIRPADYVLISGKEKSGKTSLAFNIFEHVVFQQSKRAVVISLEMKIPEISDRLFSSMGKINLTNILNGWMTDEEMTKFQNQAPIIAGGKFQWRDDLFSLPQIVSAIRQYKSKNPDTELAIVDYLQLIDAEKGKDDKRELAIAHISRTLRRLAGELNIAMLMLVQLNEDGQVRESRSPGMDCTAHIRIEPADEEGMKWARIVYQRNGPSNVGIPLAHLGQFVRFEPGTFTEPKGKPEKRRWHD